MDVNTPVREKAYTAKIAEDRYETIKGGVIWQLKLNVTHSNPYGDEYICGKLIDDEAKVVSLSIDRNVVLMNSVYAVAENAKHTTVNVTPGSLFAIGNAFCFKLYVSSKVDSATPNTVDVYEIEKGFFHRGLVKSIEKAFIQQDQIIAQGRDYILDQIMTSSLFANTKIEFE